MWCFCVSGQVLILIFSGCVTLWEFNNVSLVLSSRFPEDALYFSEGSWRLIKIGEGPLGFGEHTLAWGGGEYKEYSVVRS